MAGNFKWSSIHEGEFQELSDMFRVTPGIGVVKNIFSDYFIQNISKMCMKSRTKKGLSKVSFSKKQSEIWHTCS